jgi:ferritin-like metal-binding protein YciE
MAQRDTFLGWLKDAHSMEQALIPTLEHHAKDAAEAPQIQARIQQHIEETRRHALLVEQCIQSLGENTSSVKDAIGKVTGFLQGIGSAPFADEPVKNFLADYAAENFEVASYTSLIAAAQELGEDQIAATLQQILLEDQEMADWLKAHIPDVTSLQLQKSLATT